MIIIKISCGLGNQMFQYAFYLAAKKKYENVKIDVSEYRRYKVHNGYELAKVFGIHADEATDQEIRKLHGDTWSIPFKIRKHIWGIPNTYKTDFGDAFKTYYEDILKDGCYYAGYWLNQRYFEGIKEAVFDAFNKEQQLDDRNQSIFDELQSTESVAVHIRRGDYVGNPPYVGICTDKYYRKAINIINEKIAHPKYFFFSNDPEYVKENFGAYAYRIIDYNQGENAYLDMYLMSKAKNNIIAHSTFSYWAAWLNTNPDKLVIAPLYWLAREKERQVPARAEAILPKEWIRLDEDSD